MIMSRSREPESVRADPTFRGLWPLDCSERWRQRRFRPPTPLSSFDDARHHVVVVGLDDLAAIKRSRHQRLVRAEIVDQNLAVNLRGMQHGPPLPQQFGLV